MALMAEVSSYKTATDSAVNKDNAANVTAAAAARKDDDALPPPPPDYDAVIAADVDGLYSALH